MFTTNATPDYYETLQDAAEDLQAQGLASTIYQDGWPVAQYGPDGLIKY
jgi:hypothetical protein